MYLYLKGFTETDSRQRSTSEFLNFGNEKKMYNIVPKDHRLKPKRPKTTRMSTKRIGSI